MDLVVKRLGRVASVALLIAACWSAILIVGAFFVPAYQSTGGAFFHAGTPLSHAGTPPDSLVGVNGLSAIAVIGVPLLVTLTAGVALWLCSRRGAIPLAWTFTGLLAAFNLITMLSVGIFVLPATAALITACGTCRPRLPRGSGSEP